MKLLGCWSLFFFWFFFGLEAFDERDEEEDAPSDDTSADDAFANPEGGLPNWWEVTGDLTCHDVGIRDTVEKVMGSFAENGDIAFALFVWS